MTSKNWNVIAQKQFEAMPSDYREDWEELRKLVMQA